MTVRTQSDLIYVDNDGISFEYVPLYPDREKKNLAGRDVAYIAEGVLERKQAYEAMHGFPGGGNSVSRRVLETGMPLTTDWRELANEITPSGLRNWMTECAANGSAWDLAVSDTTGSVTFDDFVSRVIGDDAYKPQGLVDIPMNATIEGSAVHESLKNLYRCRHFICRTPYTPIISSAKVYIDRRGEYSLVPINSVAYRYAGVGCYKTADKTKDDWSYGIVKYRSFISIGDVVVKNVPSMAKVRLVFFVNLVGTSVSIGKDGTITEHGRQPWPRGFCNSIRALSYKTNDDPTSARDVVFSADEVSDGFAVIANGLTSLTTPAPVATKLGSPDDKTYVPIAGIPVLCPLREFQFNANVKISAVIELGDHTPGIMPD